MRALPTILVVVGASVALGGCDRNAQRECPACGDESSNRARAPGPNAPTQEQPPSEAPAAPPAASPAPNANGQASPRTAEIINARNVRRFDDEAPLGYVETTMLKSAVAHTEPLPERGEEVELVVGGTSVVQVAGRNGSVLVVFPDRTDTTRRLMGWVPAASVNPAPRYPCRRPQVAFQSAQGSFCATPCQQSGDCGASEACVPGGIALERNGLITNLLTYCVER